MNDPKASTSTPMLTEIVLPGIVGPEGLNIHQRPVPTPGKGQALVEVLATGVSFAEQQMRRGRYLNQPKFPFVRGYDLVGVVTAVGPQVDESLVGRRVAAVVKTGGWATHALVDAGQLVPVPDGLDAAEAETVALNGITAWQMLKKAEPPRLELAAGGGAVTLRIPPSPANTRSPHDSPTGSTRIRSSLPWSCNRAPQAHSPCASDRRWR